MLVAIRMALMLAFLVALVSVPAFSVVVNFPDPGLETAILRAVEKTNGDIRLPVERGARVEHDLQSEKASDIPHDFPTIFGSAGLDVLESFESLRSGDLAVEGTTLFLLSNMSIPEARPAILIYDTATLDLVGTLMAPPLSEEDNSFGLTCNDGLLYVAFRNWNAMRTRIFALDAETGELVRTLELGLYLTGLAWDGDAIRAIGRWDQSDAFFLYRIDAHTGQLMEAVELPRNRNYGGASWHDGYIWVVENRHDDLLDDLLLKLDPSTGALMDYWVSPSGWTKGLAITGNSVWMSDGAIPRTVYHCMLATPAWRRTLQVGDILYDPRAFASLGHTGIYIGNGMTADPGWTTVVHNVSTWDYPARDEVHILRVDAPAAVRSAAVQWAWDLGHRLDASGEYTYQWQYINKNPDFNSNWWYCSELVWGAYWNQGINIEEYEGIPLTLAELLITPVSPDDVCEDGDTITVGGHCGGLADTATTGCCEPLCGCFISGTPLGLLLTLACPADLEVIDPLGRSISPTSNEIPGAVYMLNNEKSEGETYDIVAIPNPVEGSYQVLVIPEPGASPDDTYTLNVQDTVGSAPTVLAEDIPIADIPAKPYKFLVTDEGITDKGDIDFNGSINLLDVRLCLQIAQGTIAGTTAQRDAADVDGDGDVDSDDATILAEYVVGIRVTLP